MQCQRGRVVRTVEEEEDRGRAVAVLMDVFVVPFLAGHVEVDYFVHVRVVDIECRLHSLKEGEIGERCNEEARVTFVCSSVDCSFSTTFPRLWLIADRKSEGLSLASYHRGKWFCRHWYRQR